MKALPVVVRSLVAPPPSNCPSVVLRFGVVRDCTLAAGAPVESVKRAPALKMRLDLVTAPPRNNEDTPLQFPKSATCPLFLLWRPFLSIVVGIVKLPDVMLIAVRVINDVVRRLWRFRRFGLLRHFEHLLF